MRLFNALNDELYTRRGATNAAGVALVWWWVLLVVACVRLAVDTATVKKPIFLCSNKHCSCGYCCCCCSYCSCCFCEKLINTFGAEIEIWRLCTFLLWDLKRRQWVVARTDSRKVVHTNGLTSILMLQTRASFWEGAVAWPLNRFAAGANTFKHSWAYATRPTAVNTVTFI